MTVRPEMADDDVDTCVEPQKFSCIPSLQLCPAADASGISVARANAVAINVLRIKRSATVVIAGKDPIDIAYHSRRNRFSKSLCLIDPGIRSRRRGCQ